MRARAVHGHKSLPAQREARMLDETFCVALACRIRHHHVDFRIGKDCRICLDCLFRLARLILGKHEHRGDFLRDVVVLAHRELPREAIFVLEPAVFLRPRIGVERHKNLASLGEFFPHSCYFRLVFKNNEQRYRRIKRKVRAGAYRHKLLSCHRKCNHIAIARRCIFDGSYVRDARVDKERSVKRRRLFCLCVEPEVWNYFLHR